MDEITLTKDAGTLLCILYKEYSRRKENGIEDRQARLFGDDSSIEKYLKSGLNKQRRKASEKEPANNIVDICLELHNAGLLNCFFIDNTVGESELTHKGIAYMEGSTGRRLSSLINALERIRSLLPW